MRAREEISRTRKRKKIPLEISCLQSNADLKNESDEVNDSHLLGSKKKEDLAPPPTSGSKERIVGCC